MVRGKRIIINDEIFKKEYLSGKTHVELAKQFDCSLNVISRKFKSLELNRIDKFPNCLPDKTKSLLYGTLMGDGYLNKGKKSKTARFGIFHCDKQRNYLDFKFNHLKNWITTPVKVRISKFDNPKYLREEYIGYYFQTVAHPIFENLHKEFYTKGKKTITSNILNQIDDLALAIWIADDGCFKYKQKYPCYTIATHSFSLEENILIHNWFRNTYGIKSSIYFQANKPYLVIRGDSMRKLSSIIKPHMPNSMLYKVGE